MLACSDNFTEGQLWPRGDRGNPRLHHLPPPTPKRRRPPFCALRGGAEGPAASRRGRLPFRCPCRCCREVTGPRAAMWRSLLVRGPARHGGRGRGLPWALGASCRWRSHCHLGSRPARPTWWAAPSAWRDRGFLAGSRPLLWLYCF